MRIGTLKESYIADAALFDSRTQKAWLAVAAALAFRRTTGQTWKDLRISLTKRIPVCAGTAGGSSDGAADFFNFYRINRTVNVDIEFFHEKTLLKNVTELFA